MPIYYGAPNIDDYWPHPDSIVDYRKLGSPEALEAELLRLMHDPQAYEAKLAWKKLPLRDLSPGFLRYVDDIMDEHTQCKLCRIVVQQRVKPRHLTGSHCLRNQSWMASGRSVALPPAPAAKAPAAAAKAKSGGVVTLKKDISGKPGGAECKSS